MALRQGIVLIGIHKAENILKMLALQIDFLIKFRLSNDSFFDLSHKYVLGVIF